MSESTNMNVPVYATDAPPGWTFVMKIAWWTLAAVNLTFYIIAIPAEYQSHITSSTRDLADALSAIRLTPEFYAILRTGLDITTELAFTAIGALIFIRKPRDWMVFLVAVASMTFSSMFVPTLIQLSEVQPFFRMPSAFIRTIGLATSVIVFLYLFPDGRFYPKFTRYVSVIWIILALTWFLIPSAPYNVIHLTDWASSMPQIVSILFGVYASGAVFQVLRYRHAKYALQKQQIKWFLSGITAGLAGFALYYGVMFSVPSFNEQQGLPRLLFLLIGNPIYQLSILMVPLSLAAAISRFRLWDVDLFINRSLVYAALTAAVVGLYVLSVLALEQFFHGLFHWDRSPLVIALSTLVIAFLFVPLRNMIQARVDRRFYRNKYDTDQAITQLSHHLRDEVDINRLADALINTIDETMQPEQITLWLREASPASRNQIRED